MVSHAPSNGPATAGKQRALAEQVLRVSTMREAQALATYFEELLRIRSANIELGDKLRHAVHHTLERQLILPLLTLLVKEAQAVWGSCGVSGRIGMVAAAATLAAFGQTGAGIAALGTAVGVPLWIVAGGGAALADAYLELFHTTRLRPQFDIEAEYGVAPQVRGDMPAPDDRQAVPPLRI